jgi:hypothetical protein
VAFNPCNWRSRLLLACGVAVLAAGCAGGAGQLDLGGDVTAAQRGRVLLLLNVNPWESAANQVIMGGSGISYDIRTSSQFAANPGMLNNYRMVVIASDQPQAFYDIMQAHNATFAVFVDRGGRLNYHAATCGWAGGGCSGINLPFGLTAPPNPQSVNRVVSPGHALVTGVPPTFVGSRASHNYIQVPGGGFTIVTVNEDGQPTLVTRTGANRDGRLVVSGQALEYGWLYGEATGTILTNMYAYASGRTTSASGADVSASAAGGGANNPAPPGSGGR